MANYVTSRNEAAPVRPREACGRRVYRLELTAAVRDVPGHARGRDRGRSPPGSPDFSRHRWFSLRLRHRLARREGITAGCGPGVLPELIGHARADGELPRPRAPAIPTTADDCFADDGSSAHEADINRIATSRITGGCGARVLSPAVVTREQMASFLVRALNLPARPRTTSPMTKTARTRPISTGWPFRHHRWMRGHELLPPPRVTREQMAAFLHRAIDD